MKTLIVYAGKYGCTKNCAQELKNKLTGEVDIADATKGNLPSIGGYDNVIIGGSIYMGQLNKKLKTFANNNLDKLLTKKVGLFLVCGFADKVEETMANVYPQKLRDHAVAMECFGGEMNVDKMGFVHKKMIQMLGKEIDASQIKLMPENIEKMAKTFAGE